MKARLPTDLLVVDTNIILSAAISRRARHMFVSTGQMRHLLTSERAVEEVRGVLPRLRATRAIDEETVSTILTGTTIAPRAVYAEHLDIAATSLRLASHAANGSTRDDHILALAWALDADIWSHDRDFAGTGWPSWSSANLAAALTADPAIP